MHKISQALILFLALAYLGGGMVPALVALIFSAGILFPAAALSARFCVGRSTPSGLRILLGMVLAVILITPCYYLRRSLPVAPSIADTAIIVILSLTAFRTGAAARFYSDLREISVRANGYILFVCLPLLFCLIWMGFAAQSGAQVLFCGLFPVDFCSLASVVSLINASPGPPLNAIIGTGPLSYHWYYFAMPAWLTHFMGFSLRAGAALIVCNYAVACLLCLALYETAIRFCRGPHAGRQATLTATVVTFAPLITHIVLWIAPGNSFLAGGRNNLLLSVVNSMVAFGNNTLALTMALLILMLAGEWQRNGSIRHLLAGGLLLAVIPGYSATLIIPLALAGGIGMAMLMKQRPVAVLSAGLCTGAACFLTLCQLHGFSGDRGLPDFAFDGGRFLGTLLLNGLPLWAVAFWSLRDLRLTRPYLLLIAACIAVPSILYVRNSPTGQSDLSMKTGSLILVALTPLIALGLGRIAEDWRRNRWLAAFSVLLLAAGFCHTAVYVLQFPLTRLGNAWQHLASPLPADYCRAMDYLRVSTPGNAVVLDGEALTETFPANTPSLLAERRCFLPQTSELASIARKFPLVLQRRTDFQRWGSGGFNDPALSKEFAQNADILVVKSSYLHSDYWEERRRIGAYTIYESRIHQAHDN